MGRALVIGALLMLWPAAARGEDDSTIAQIETAGVTVTLSGSWKGTYEEGYYERWRNFDLNFGYLVGDVTFRDGQVGGACRDGENQASDFFEVDERVNLAMVQADEIENGDQHVYVCILAGDTAYELDVVGYTGTPYIDAGTPILDDLFYELREMVQRYAAALVARAGSTVSTGTEVATVDPAAAPEDPFETATADGPTEQASQGFAGKVLDAIWPRTILGAFVKRRDDLGSSIGLGLSLSRLTWRKYKRRAVGYDLTGGIADKWWTVSAQLRPGVSAAMKDLAADAYVALGVDGTGGESGPDVPFAPVVGIGADVIAPLPIFTADLAAQVLADPTGLHSYTLHGGLLFGDGPTRPRVGVSYVSHQDAGAVWLVTFGVSFLGRESGGSGPPPTEYVQPVVLESDYTPSYDDTSDDTTTTYDDTSDDTTTTYDDTTDDTTDDSSIDPGWRDMVERTWDGESEVIAMLVEHGRTGAVIHAELDMTHTMQLWLSGDSVTGNVTTVVYIDDIGYEAKSELWGTIDFTDQTLSLQGNLKAATPPPYGLMWCNGDQKLKLYADAERAGHYILRGTMATLCGGDSDIEWSDR